MEVESGKYIFKQFGYKDEEENGCSSRVKEGLLPFSDRRQHVYLVRGKSRGEALMV